MTPITVTDLNQVGRTNAPDPNQPRIFVTYNADFSASADVTLDFTLLNQQQQFGTPRALFIDNGSNPEEVSVYVSRTDQYFTVPAYAQGQFKLDAAINSTIQFVTDGGAADTVTITIYNWEVAPQVWYRYGAVNKDIPLQMQGAMDEGDTVAAETFKKPVYIGGIDRATGLFHAVAVDSTGRLDFSSSITIGAVTIADGGDVAEGATTDAAVTNPASSGSIIALLKGLLTLFNRPPTATKSNVVAAVADTLLLASNVSRKGATIYNDSTSILYLSLGTVAASATSFTTQIEAGGYYEVPAQFTNQVRGIWVSATGNARVTEIV